jgi:hypothetical protein
MSVKFVAVVSVALALAFTAGWAVGASGRAAVEVEKNRSDMRAEFAEAHALVLEGRLSVSHQNFGNAMEQFRDARGMVGRVQTHLREQGLASQAGGLEIVISHLNDAQHATSALDSQAAEQAADEALSALDAAGKGGA